MLLKENKTTKLLTKNRYDVLEQLKIINNNDSVFVISGKLWPWLVTISETLMTPDITKTECNNCFIIHCFKKTTTNTTSHNN